MRGPLVKQLMKIRALTRSFPTRMTRFEEVESLVKALRPKVVEGELIRLGPDDDGGYLVPDDMEGLAACFSPGVSTESGFELDCAKRGMNVFLADRSVEQPSYEHGNFQFEKKFIGATTDDVFMTLDDWVTRSVPDPDAELLLQMDIEGAEYEVILAASDQLMKRFRIIVAEFHMLDQMWNYPFFRLASQAFRKILQTHTCVHLHPNNVGRTITSKHLEIPRLIEFTFVRNDRGVTEEFQTNFPNPLDHDNSSKPTLPLPTCWYGN